MFASKTRSGDYNGNAPANKAKRLQVLTGFEFENLEVRNVCMSTRREDCFCLKVLKKFGNRKAADENNFGGFFGGWRKKY